MQPCRVSAVPYKEGVMATKRISDRELVRRASPYFLLEGIPVGGRLGVLNAVFGVYPKRWAYHFDMSSREHVLNYEVVDAA